MSLPQSELDCPACGYRQTAVKDSRGVKNRTRIRRRRECLACGHRFRTRETVEPLTEAQAFRVLEEASNILLRLRRRRAA